MTFRTYHEAYIAARALSQDKGKPATIRTRNGIFVIHEEQDRETDLTWKYVGTVDASKPADLPTEKEIQAVRNMIEAVAEAVQGLGSVPSGHLYARLMQYFTLEQYEAVISLLVEQGRIQRDRRTPHLLTWVGKK